MKKTILSGIQSSGRLTLGNYLGALKNFKELEDSGEYKTWYFVADLHSITVRQDPKELHQRSLEIMKLYLSLGLGTSEDSNIFYQSHVHQHAELGWALGCYCNLGELARMTQFKDKAQKHDASKSEYPNVSSGLFTYPVLMAADILLYQPDFVPTGADQKQHLELSRDIAIRFNNLYGETFKVPEPFIPKEGARIMSLQEPMAKMSKSDKNENGYILMLDEPDVIRKKVKKSVTDSVGIVKYESNDESRAGVANLMNIYSVIQGKSFAEIEKEFDGLGYGAFKEAVGEAVVSVLKPIQDKFNQYSDEDIKKYYQNSAEKAKSFADKTLRNVYEKIGFVRS